MFTLSQRIAYLEAQGLTQTTQHCPVCMHAVHTSEEIVIEYNVFFQNKHEVHTHHNACAYCGYEKIVTTSKPIDRI